MKNLSCFKKNVTFCLLVIILSLNNVCTAATCTFGQTDCAAGSTGCTTGSQCVTGECVCQTTGASGGCDGEGYCAY